MNSIKILPITDQVPFTAYQIRGYETGILLANLANAEQFLFNYYINYFWRFETKKIVFRYNEEKSSYFQGQGIFYIQNYPWDKNHVSKEEILDLILHWLDNGIYIFGSFNEKYIPCKGSFGKRNFVHGYQLHGFDRKQEILYAMGYTKNQKFEIYTIPYSNFLDAIDKKKSSTFWLKYLNRERTYEFDLHRVYWELKDYLHSEYTVSNAPGRHPDDQYGISANRAFQRYIRNIENYRGHLDPRYSRLFYEHKFFMCKRLAYMHQNGYIENYNREYSALASKSQTIHFLFLKYDIKNDKRILESLDRLLEEINNEDEKILNRVLDELTEYFARQKKEIYR